MSIMKYENTPNPTMEIQSKNTWLKYDDKFQKEFNIKVPPTNKKPAPTNGKIIWFCSLVKIFFWKRFFIVVKGINKPPPNDKATIPKIIDQSSGIGFPNSPAIRMKWTIPIPRNRNLHQLANFLNECHKSPKYCDDRDITNEKINDRPAIIAYLWTFGSELFSHVNIPIIIENEAKNASGWEFFKPS